MSTRAGARMDGGHRDGVGWGDRHLTAGEAERVLRDEPVIVPRFGDPVELEQLIAAHQDDRQQRVTHRQHSGKVSWFRQLARHASSMVLRMPLGFSSKYSPHRSFLVVASLLEEGGFQASTMVRVEQTKD